MTQVQKSLNGSSILLANVNGQAGEQLLIVSQRSLRIAQTVLKAISGKLGRISVHGLLAVDLSLDSSPTKAPWRAVLPTIYNLFEAMPYTWEPAFQILLPPAAKALLENQQKKFSKAVKKLRLD